MSDPSAHVPIDVLPHIHLVSSYKFPVLASLSPDQALEYLKNAPKIVRDVASVAWQYFQQPPPDGTVLLTWQPPQRHGRFSSDGYVWADHQESSFTAEVRGYTLEVLIQQAGCRWGLEPVATHRRARFHIINKNPAVDPNGPQPDPSLWIVHYGQTDHQYRFPAERIPPTQETQRVLQDRQRFERQGQLLRKDFMLHDRANWPKVEFSPAGQMVGAQGPQRNMYGANAMHPMQQMARHPAYYQANQAPNLGPSPAKRPRQGPPPQIPGVAGPSMAAVAGGIEDLEEENTTYGDALDHLTPSEISKMRYTQHHEWMEEIYSSPYAAGQIKPIDLGFGLVGELSTLTKGIFTIPDRPSITNTSKVEPPKGYKKLEPEQYVEFKQRVEEYERDGLAEIQKMKAEHAKKIADLKRTKTYVQAERRLREAVWDPESSSDSFRQGIESTDEAAKSAFNSKDKAEQIINEVQKSLNITVGPRQHVTTVEKGGLLEEQDHQTNGANGRQDFQENGGMTGLLNDAALEAENSAARLLDEFTQNSAVNTPVANLSNQAVSRPQSLSRSAAATPQGINTNATPTNQDQQVPSGRPSNVDRTSVPPLDGIDMDVDMSDLANAPVEGAENEWVMVDQVSTNNNHANAPQTTEMGDSTGPAATSSGQPAVTSTVSNDPIQGGSPGLFDSDFGAFDNLDTAGDPLADYVHTGDDLGLDLDNSAFGDAFQGTESNGDLE